MTSYQRLTLLFVGIFFIVTSGSASAEMFKCTNSSGAKQFASNKELEKSGWSCKKQDLPPLQRYSSESKQVEMARKAGVSVATHGPRVIRVEYKETENPDIEVGAVKQCTVSGVAHSRLQTNAKIVVSRSGLEDAEIEVPINEYNSEKSECCFKEFSTVIDGSCGRPEIRAEQLR